MSTTGPISAKPEQLAAVKYNAEGLVPVIAQDASTNAVLMMAGIIAESLALSLVEGRMAYWSRSRQVLWHKGATSGNTQKVKSITYDCDADALLVKVEQRGVACHTGNYSCFFTSLIEPGEPSRGLGETLGRLARVINQRNAERPAGSYTADLLASGTDRILKKVAEEAGEVIVAAKNHERKEIAWEVSDLLYHTLVLLESEGVGLEEIAWELQSREGHREQSS